MSEGMTLRSFFRKGHALSGFFLTLPLGTVSKKKLMEFSIKGPDPASQPLNGKKNKIKHGLKML